jgi:hypothetical protein
MRETNTLFRMWEEEGVPLGALLCHVRLVQATYVRTSPWHMSGQVGWYIADPVVLTKPIPCRGAQGLWEVPHDVLSQARDDFSAQEARYQQRLREERARLGFAGKADDQ